MTEDYLHYIWKFSKFEQKLLTTTKGDLIEVVNKGIHNFNAGPDFLEGQVRIDGTLWVGSIEIHIKTSDWNAHKHQNDKRYNNVVLHVVYEHDLEIFNNNGEEIPVLELKNRIDESAFFYYEQFLNKGNDLPCQRQIPQVPSFVISSTLDNMLVERVERKSQEILLALESNKGDWEETFHQFLFKYMGMKVNADQMVALAKKVPLRILNKESSSLFTTEALIFGQSGLLERKQDISYHEELRNEYLYLKQKYGLEPMPEVVWKFSRMRPPNFPTLRMAQLAAIYNASRQLFQLVRERISVDDIATIFDVEPSLFWKSHYSFSAEKHALNSGKMGQVTLDTLIINWIVPFSFAYGRSVGNSLFEEYAFKLLESMKPERNSITNRYEKIGFVNQSGRDSQSIIQLSKQYCEGKKCLNCKIGVYLLQ